MMGFNSLRTVVSLRVARILGLMLFTAACTKPQYRPENSGRLSPGSFSLSSVTLDIPEALKTHTQSGRLDGYTLELIPGACEDGGAGTSIARKSAPLADQKTIVADLRIKAKCSYTLSIDLGKLGSSRDRLDSVYLTNEPRKTSVDQSQVTGPVTQISIALFVTASGTAALGIQPSQPNPQNPPSVPQTPPSVPQNPPSVPQTPPSVPQDQPIPQPQPLPQPIPQPQPLPQPIPQPQPLPQPLPPTVPGQDPISNGGEVQLSKVKFMLPIGYRAAQNASDNGNAIVTMAYGSKQATLFDRPAGCSIRSFVKSDAQVVAPEATYQAGSMAWTTLGTKFTSKVKNETVFASLFVTEVGGRCTFGYVTAKTQEQAWNEAKALLDGSSIR